MGFPGVGSYIEREYLLRQPRKSEVGTPWRFNHCFAVTSFAFCRGSSMPFTAASPAPSMVSDFGGGRLIDNQGFPDMERCRQDSYRVP